MIVFHTLWVNCLKGVTQQSGRFSANYQNHSIQESLELFIHFPHLHFSMIICRTERAYAVIGTRLLTPLVCENVAPKTLAHRLTEHVQYNRTKRSQHRCITNSARCRVDVQSELVPSFWSQPPIIESKPTPSPALPTQDYAKLPQTCPGCGALTQESESSSPGFYSRDRRAVKIWLRGQKRSIKESHAQAVTELHDEEIDEEHSAVPDPEAEADTALDKQGRTKEPAKSKMSKIPSVPLCDRCHDLIHNSKGHSIAHPSIENIADSIAESPFKRNHVYHVVDAADFPMSVIPAIFSKLELAKSRSQNRRSQHDFSTKPTISFIITRSDLLGSTKEMVDGMMPYFQSVLRKALGRLGKDMRMGNVHLVSAKRGWWTKEIKEEIWKRGGGNWMVGKVNVGKSNLFEVLFPKGSGERAPNYTELELEQRRKSGSDVDLNDLVLDEHSLLPPAQPEVPFPVFPVVSSLPGTTASPIRLPFGNHKGELIDLPGLERGELEQYVEPDHRLDLVMTHRHKVEQHIIKLGQSMILGGGLIRITPQLDQSDRSTTVLAYPFVPLKAHVTSTEKAASQQLQQRESGIESILAADAGAHMCSAGHIELSTDVTKSRAGSLIRSGVELSKLPFRVYATDILVEGLGWIELVCQVRKRSTSQPKPRAAAYSNSVSDEKENNGSFQPVKGNSDFVPLGSAVHDSEDQVSLPTVEVFSPNGKHVSSRPSLDAWRRWTEGRRKGNVSKTELKKKYIARYGSRA